MGVTTPLRQGSKQLTMSLVVLFVTLFLYQSTRSLNLLGADIL